MQKKLIALAVAGLASSAAFAQSNVTIYGLLQPSYDRITAKDAADNVSFTGMQWNNSRIGFKGEEALGNGLKAIFQIETNVALTERGDSPSALSDRSGLGSRDSWVGLAGSFGSLTFGNHQTAYTRVTNLAGYDFFADSISDINNVLGVSSALDADFNRRVNKSAYYTSPVFAGFRVDASYGLRDTADQTGYDTTAADDNVFATSATYNLGGFNAIAGYESQADGPAVDLSAWKLGASYKFSFGTKIVGVYETLKREISGADAGKVKNYVLGVSHPITSNVTLAANYLKASDSDQGLDDGYRNFNVGADYAFSKRTSVGAFYTNLKNKTDGIQALDAGYGQGTAGSKVSGFSVRMKHAF
jgi:predicted porin